MSTSKRCVLVVEDDRKTAATVKLYLEHEGFEAVVAHDGRAGLAAARDRRFDLVVLDLMLPGVDGLRICTALREEMDVPIIMLTARTAEEDRVRGLNLGADDYLGKPFSPRELMARVRAVLRRADPRDTAGPKRLAFVGLTIDLELRQVRVNDQEIGLTPAEFDLLCAFARFPRRVFTRDELIELAFGPDYEGLDRTVDAHIMNLRRKIERDRNHPAYIQTVFGVGYRFGGTPDAA